MSSVRDDLESFHQFAIARLAGSASAASLDELLMEWQDLRDRESINEAISQGLAEIAAGRVISAREAMEELRKEFGFGE